MLVQSLRMPIEHQLEKLGTESLFPAVWEPWDSP